MLAHDAHRIEHAPQHPARDAARLLRALDEELSDVRLVVHEPRILFSGRSEPLVQGLEERLLGVPPPEVVRGVARPRRIAPPRSILACEELRLLRRSEELVKR